MQWTPDMLRAFGVGEQGVQQVFSQSAPVPKSGPFPNYTPYTQAGRATGIPPSGRALIPASGSQAITDAVYRELSKQGALPQGATRPQIGYTPKFTQASTTGGFQTGAAYNPSNKMYQGGQGFGKIPMLGKVARAGIGGAGGAVLTDMLFPDSANEIDDVAMINKFQPLKNQGMTTPQAAGFPALQQMPNQAQAERDFRQSQETVYGKDRGTGYIQFDETGAYGGKQRKAGERLVFDNSTPLGGFGRSSTADADMARQAQWAQEAEARQRQALLQKEYEKAVKDQEDFESGVRFALRYPNAPESAYYLAQLQQGRKVGQQVTPLSERQSNLFKVRSEGEAKLIQAQAQIQQAIGSPEERELKRAQAKEAEARTAGLPKKSAIEAAKVVADAQRYFTEEEGKAYKVAMESGDPINSLIALGTRYPNLMRVAAAMKAAKDSEG